MMYFLEYPDIKNYIYKENIMTLTERIEALLKSWNDIVCIPNTRANDSNELYQGVNLNIEFFVAPKNGLYTVEELQEFLFKLASRNFCKSITSFLDRGPCMEIGSLHFWELIGKKTIREKVTIFDKHLRLAPGFLDGKRTVLKKENVLRCINVRLYPDETILRKATLEGTTSLSLIFKDDYPVFSEIEKKKKPIRYLISHWFSKFCEI